ncbi:MAG: BON domain-containing protein [Pseudobdellovibrionaceae bacterium]
MKKQLMLVILLSGFSTLSLCQTSSSGSTGNTGGTPSSGASDTSANPASNSTTPESSTSGAIHNRDNMGTQTERMPSNTATSNNRINTQDTALIRNIRSQIVADKSLSTRAKNITVLSDRGRVILKGAVANNQEKARVEEIAKKASGTKSVENLTEVQTY